MCLIIYDCYHQKLLKIILNILKTIVETKVSLKFINMVFVVVSVATKVTRVPIRIHEMCNQRFFTLAGVKRILICKKCKLYRKFRWSFRKLEQNIFLL